MIRRPLHTRSLIVLAADLAAAVVLVAVLPIAGWLLLDEDDTDTDEPDEPPRTGLPLEDTIARLWALALDDDENLAEHVAAWADGEEL